LNFLQFASIIFIILNIDFPDTSNKIGQVFKIWNKSGNGRMSKEELKNGLNSLTFIKINEIELNEIFSKLDTEKNKLIGYSNFLAATIDFDQLMSENNIRCIFGLLDAVIIMKGNKGEIYMANIHNLLKCGAQGSKSKIDEFWRSLGKDMNMKLNYQEFRSIINTKEYKIFR